MVNRRVPFREEHLRLAANLASGVNSYSQGALAEPVDRALLCFHVR